MTTVALDTSASIPWLHRSHPAHDAVHRAVGTRSVSLTGHSLAETYSVLTWAPGALRLPAGAAADVLEQEFGPPVCLPPTEAAAVARHMSERAVEGGATYDGLVALAALAGAVVLVTRDARAVDTYERLGVGYEVVVD